MRRYLWVWPLLAAVLLAFVGLWVRGRMEGAMKTQIAESLHAILDANTEALGAWTSLVKSSAEQTAENDRVRDLVGGLVQQAAERGASPAVLLSAPQGPALRAQLKTTLERYGFTGFIVIDTNGVIVASAHDHLVGLESPPRHDEYFLTAFGGQATVTRPFPSLVLLTNRHGHALVGVPTMFAVAPVISNNDGHVQAILGLRLEPAQDFSRILTTARSGESGETYAFDRNGLMLSGSRFDEDLKRRGLIPDTEDAQSVLTLELRDPLVDLSRGKASPKRRTELPFTHAVTEAIAGRYGVDVGGYRDYRGKQVVGAWRWLPEYNFGLVTEVDESEALEPLWILRQGFFFIFTLLVLGAAAIFVLMRLANRFQDSARKAALKAMQLGQYALDQKIGEGSFGAVYRAHHALMRRPVAVKLLDPKVADDGSIARFEREVQLTCQLTHPNTIVLYDYGRTPEGQFYYAMEFLDGLSLDDLVKKHGRQPEGRVIHLLRQICASLAEAHGQGLIHRDIKPHNIFLTCRGGIPDFVKVLDFGLVKSRNVEGQLELTGANVTLGTPLYMSPEAVEQPDAVDARSDLYSLGAVAYYLVTGETVFFGTTIGEVMMQQVKGEPERPSARLKDPLSKDFEDLLMMCLAKKAEDRPAGVRELEEALARCSTAEQWNNEHADEWWRQRSAVQFAKTVVTSQVESS